MATEITFSSRFPEIIAELPAIIDEAIAEGAEIIAEDARSRVPIRTGALELSIESEQREQGTYEVVAGGKEAFYGFFVEFGTSKMAPEPFMIPAEEAEREFVISIVDAALHNL